MAQLNSASDYGSEGYRFESCRGHLRINKKWVPKGTHFFMLDSDASLLASAEWHKKIGLRQYQYVWYLEIGI